MTFKKDGKQDDGKIVEKITILHTNDLHSHLENWPQIRRYLSEEKERYQAAGHTVLTFDIGDAMDREHALTEATDGTANIRLMNTIHYDGVTIGNNEGLGNTKDQLNHLYDEANFDVILGNLLTAPNKTQPKWAVPAKLIETAAHTRILVLGLTAPYTLTYPLVGWQPISVERMLPRLLAQYAGQYDDVVLLSHLGIDVDRMIAKRYPEVNVIIGAHTHHLLVHGELVNQSLLAAAGKWGQYIGTIQLQLENHHIVAKEASVVKTDTLQRATTDRDEINGYIAEGEHLLSQRKIATLPVAMDHSWEGHSRLTSEGLAALEDYAQTDAAIINGGLFMTDLPAGEVTANDFHNLLPHAMHAMRVTLNGYDLWRLIREMEKNRVFLSRFPIKGMGFRGKVFGSINYSGISYDEHDQQVLFRGEVLSPVRHYTIAMPDHYLFIPFFPTISIVGQNEIMYGKLLRNVLSDYLAKRYPLQLGKEDVHG
ncbi:bifunctional metallophosphatase/5'-nucleotidase [Secundilactobacillus collinoides]|uniref:5-nucleotidase n=1 Tax=Secundilactobacillus collinoides DSM 20515 = JCM 1123 TaxID=1423733 RepID=A0A0R2B5E9_SECCO|nr:5'-nucleotidase C-terminal domain-containing protein [Secundilactobacillus collinoides]KRM74686.1 5-nucleotidase [Secundilactobacillus collinoides DSM 20515 = JCM 1123]